MRMYRNNKNRLSVVVSLSLILGLFQACGGYESGRADDQPRQSSAEKAPQGVSQGEAQSTDQSGPSALPEGFVHLASVDPSIVEAMAYFTPFNFVGAPVDGYEAPRCILSREAAQALKEAQALALEEGYSLIVFDCYRPQKGVDHFVRWSEDPETRTKAEYYPDLPKAELFDLGYIARRSGHSRGSTVDLGLVPVGEGAPNVDKTDGCMQSPQPPVLDFGTRFDCFDTLSNTRDPRITGQAWENRARLLRYMESAGFDNYRKEWWHFTLENEPFADTYHDFDVVGLPERK